MSKGKGGWNEGDSPWGKPTGNRGNGNNSGGNGGKPPQNEGPDLDDVIEKLQLRLQQWMKGDGSNNSRTIIILVLIACAIWFSSGIYLVDTDEQGVVMRFGKFDRITEPGLNYHLPYPLESVETPKVTTIRKIEIGIRSDDVASRAQNSFIPQESLMLTGDENIVDIKFDVQWRVVNAQSFVFNVRDPEATVKMVAESAMREIIGKSKIASALAEGRFAIGRDTKTLIQQTLDNYGAGIEIVSLNMLPVDPPAEVIDAFRDVQSARADQERSRNEALSYRNDIVPKSRGQAEKILQDAQAYEKQIVARSEGEASRFKAIYEQYAKAKNITRKRMYLETMEQVLTGMSKLVIDQKSSNGVVPYLPLNTLKPAAEGKPVP